MGELRGGKVGFAVAFALFPFFEEGESELWLGGVVAVVWWGVRCGRVRGMREGEGGRGGKREKGRTSTGQPRFKEGTTQNKNLKRE